MGTLLSAKENNPYLLSNMQIIETNMKSFLGELNLAREKQKKASKKQIEEIKILIEEEISSETSEQKVVLTRKTEEKTIYLTFDDGPLLGTANVLQVLQEEDIEATMFFVGMHIENNKRLFKKALDMPNLCISNHTYSHANEKYAHFYSNMSKVLEDVAKSQQIIGGKKYLRLAGRNVWRLPEVHKNDKAISKKQRIIEVSKYDALMDKGYQIYGWDIEWQFDHHTGKPSYSVATIVEKIERNYARGKMTKKGKMILLAHDYMFRGEKGISVLRAFIHKLKEKNWKFKTLDKYSGTLI